MNHSIFSWHVTRLLTPCSTTRLSHFSHCLVDHLLQVTHFGLMERNITWMRGVHNKVRSTGQSVAVQGSLQQYNVAVQGLKSGQKRHVPCACLQSLGATSFTRPTSHALSPIDIAL